MSETILNIVWTVHEIPAFHVHHSSNTCQKQHNFYPVQNSTEHKSMTTMWTCSDVTKKNGRTQSVWVEWSVSRDELARVNKCVKGIWAYFIFSLCLSLLRYNSLHVSPLVVEKNSQRLVTVIFSHLELLWHFFLAENRSALYLMFLLPGQQHLPYH